jgi:phosphatidate cytidylyltransferase
VISAIVMVLVALAVAYQGGWSFALFWLLAGIAVAIEWAEMARVGPRLPVRILYGAGLALMTLFYLAGTGLGVAVLATGVVALLIVTIPRSTRDRLWALGGFGYAAVIVVVPTLVRDHPDFGLVGLFWMFAVVWATDIAAYFTGRKLGGPKLWRRVSPKKTWSGFCGGVIAAMLAGVAVAAVADRAGWVPPAGLGTAALISCVASIASQLGDLGESALKRKFDVKDSSRLIPGHGGVMDRLDGFWAVALLVGIVLLAERL